MKKLHVNFLFYILIIAFTGCTRIEDKAFDFAKEEIAKILNDPDSAKFSDVYTTKVDSNPDGSGLLGVCGRVNGKNAFGAYAGSIRFVAVIHVRKDKTLSVFDAVLDEKGSHGPLIGTFDQNYWNEYCMTGNSTKKS